MQILLWSWPETIEYISLAPYFWASMGSTFSTGMVIGALLYNGDLKRVQKAILSISCYIGFVLFTTLARLSSLSINSAVMANAQIVTILVVSFFYVIGMYFGVSLLYFLKRKKHDN